MWRLWPCLSLLAALATATAQQDPQNMVTYEERFITGVKKYAQEKWSDAIVHIGQAMDEYSQLEDARLKCFSICDKEDEDPFLSEDVKLRFFGRVTQKASCIKRCEEDILGLLPWGGVSHYVLDQLKIKEGYNYLQMSLYKESKIRDAARASATFSYYNPHNIHIKKNVYFYKSYEEVTEEDQVSMETLKYRELFAEGHRQFYAHDWGKMVDTLEESLEHFYVALNECRTLCLGPIQYDAVLDFAQIVGKLYTNRLECQVKCVNKLGYFRGDRREDFFGTYFHYLQQGYFHLNESLKALQATAAHLRLEPNSEVAKRNSVFYLRQPGVTKKDLVPREDVLPEIVKRERDLTMLHFFRDIAGHTPSDEEAWKQESEEEGMDEILLEEDFQKFPVGSPAELPLTIDNVEPVVVQTSADFGGLERFVADELLTTKQCEQLINLASFGSEGDGYDRKSPHTTLEKFEGLHILDAAKRSVNGEFESHLPWLYLNSSSVAKDVVAKEFDLTSPLYFSYTHLVCRTAVEGEQAGRSDLSHPVHSDNCILNEATRECNKVPPAYTWRDYSAILYLNDDFEGGDFFFAHSLKDLSPDVRVKPRCGRLVGFAAGKENLHGVTAVTRGKRCAVALWFTLDVDHKESTFDKAEQTLRGN